MLKNTEHCLVSPQKTVEEEVCRGLVGEMTGELWRQRHLYSKTVAIEI